MTDVLGVPVERQLVRAHEGAQESGDDADEIRRPHIPEEKGRRKARYL